MYHFIAIGVFRFELQSGNAQIRSNLTIFCLLWPWNFTDDTSSCYYHHQIGSIHLSHCYISPWLYAWDVCYIIFCHLVHIRSGKTGNLFSLLLCSLWWVQIFGYVWACRSYSFVQYTISLSSLRKLIGRHWTYKMPVRYILSSVINIKHILSVIHYTIFGAVCFQFTHFSCDDWEHIYTLSYYHPQIGSMNYYPLFRVRSWNNGVRCMSFYILLKNNRAPLLYPFKLYASFHSNWWV